MAACMSSWVRVKHVLDVPCGHGRVLRHLVKLFPAATFDACDIDANGVAFCASQFGATPINSAEDLTAVTFPKQYDLIWVGSLFTHVCRERTRLWLAHLAKQLSGSGIIVATFHGRYAATHGGYIGETTWAQIRKDYEQHGFGYGDYPSNVLSNDGISGSYGVSLSSPAVVVSDAMLIPDTRVFSYTERGWAGHHDVLVIGKPGVLP